MSAGRASSTAPGRWSPGERAPSARTSWTSSSAAGAAEVVVLDNLVRGRVANLDRALSSAPGVVRLVEGDIRDVALGARS